MVSPTRAKQHGTRWGRPSLVTVPRRPTGAPATRRRISARSITSIALDAEADAEGHLEAADVAALDGASDAADLEPVEVADRLGRGGHAVADRLVDALAGRADDFGDAVGGIAVVRHG